MVYNFLDSMNIGIYIGQFLLQNIMIVQYNSSGFFQVYGFVIRFSIVIIFYYFYINISGYIMVFINSLFFIIFKFSIISLEIKFMKSQILEKMRVFRDRGKYCDVVIDVKGVRFYVYRNILAVWSFYFDCQLLSENYVMRDLLIVNYDSYEVFLDLLDFFYLGIIVFREINFFQFFYLVVSFQIDFLKYYCEEFLRSNFYFGNFLSTYFLLRKYNLKSLEEFIVSFI